VALRTVEELPARDGELRWAALLSAAGSTEGAVAMLARLRSSNRRIERGGGLAGAVARVAGLPGGIGGLARDTRVRRRWMVALGRDLVPPALRILAVRARVEAVSPVPDAAEALRVVRRGWPRALPLATGELALTGRDLIRAGHRPGPAFGRVLDRLLTEVAHPWNDRWLPNETLPLLARAETLLAAEASK
jgi:hypothetical protein